ncbi:unnamed protein product [Cochlearia groenlandica]
MKSNELEAKKAMDLAEKKLSIKDYNVAKKLIIKAQNLNPNLDGLEQLLIMINVHIYASNAREEEPDWYGVLGLDSLADEKAIKKQYKRLALLLHPDKNKFNGAEEAFKLVLEALCVLSDETKRKIYDGKIKKKRPRKTSSSTYDWCDEKKEETMRSNKPHKQSSSSTYDCDAKKQKSYKRHRPTKPTSTRTHDTFWTMCDQCNTYHEFGKPSFLNQTLYCPNFGRNR